MTYHLQPNVDARPEPHDGTCAEHPSQDRAWVLLKSGQRLDLLDPSPLAWTDEDLATGLSRTYRWGGHSKWALPLSVAQHSLTVLALRRAWAPMPLTAAEELRELLHDAEEGLLGYDAITPLKPHLGEGFARLTGKLTEAVARRYQLPAWTPEAYAQHKLADRVAAASEAVHVVGWSMADIYWSLKIDAKPLADDPVPPEGGMLPWQPWPPMLASAVFLATMWELMDRVAEEATLPAPEVAPAPLRSTARQTFVLVEGGGQTVEGEIVSGTRDDDGTWNLDSVYTVRTNDGEFIRVHGWNCITEIQ